MDKAASSPAEYSLAAKVTHWATASIFLLQFPIGIIMVQLGSGSTADFLKSLHLGIGFLILWISLLRLFYRLRADIPRRRSHLADWHFRATRVAHATLYALLILVPLTGWMGSSAANALSLFGAITLPSILAADDAHAMWLLWTHGLAAFGLIILVAFHIGFALQGYLENSDDAEDAQAPPPAPAASR